LNYLLSLPPPARRSARHRGTPTSATPTQDTGAAQSRPLVPWPQEQYQPV